MKTKKNKVLIPIISVVSVGLLVGVGFATWTIAGTNVTTSTSDNTISAEAMTDKRATLTCTDAAQTISFSSDKTLSTTNSWLATDSTGKAENLGFSFTFTLASKDNKTAVGTIVKSLSYKLEVIDNSSKGWADAVSKNYVSTSVKFTEPDEATYKIGGTTDGTYSTTSITKASETIKFTGSFAWGTKFSSENPYKYYNDQTQTDTLTNDASTSLSTLYKDLSGVKFKLTVTTVVA